MQIIRALVSHSFTNGSGLLLKKYSIKCEKGFRLWIVLFWTKKRHNVSHYIYYLANVDNIHIVLENDNTVLIKGLKKRL